jgi:hypothetical protein
MQKKSRKFVNPHSRPTYRTINSSLLRHCFADDHIKRCCHVTLQSTVYKTEALMAGSDVGNKFCTTSMLRAGPRGVDVSLPNS